jgi:hypothetical protein
MQNECCCFSNKNLQSKPIRENLIEKIKVHNDSDEALQLN